MTKKDYIVIADTLKELFSSSKTRFREQQKRIIVQYFTENLILENPRFNSQKFCDYIDEK